MSYRWPFGIFAGRDLTQIPTWHLEWIPEEAKRHPDTTGFTPSMVKAVKAELKRRKSPKKRNGSKER